jgi:mannose/fructose/N-acetylgalactosamine-specific phosphotransferase system component IID
MAAQRQPFTDLSINCICFKTLHFNPNTGCLLHFVLANVHVYILLLYTMKQTLHWGVTCTRYMGHNIINDLSDHAKLDHMMLLLLVTKESSSNTCRVLI